jgi:hypothetical protein
MSNSTIIGEKKAMAKKLTVNPAGCTGYEACKLACSMCTLLRDKGPGV